MKTHKKCSRCFQILPVTEFSVNRRGKDGLYHSCKACWSKYLKHRDRPVEDEWIEMMQAKLLRLAGQSFTWEKLCKMLPENTTRYRRALGKALEKVGAEREPDCPFLAYWIPLRGRPLRNE